MPIMEIPVCVHVKIDQSIPGWADDVMVSKAQNEQVEWSSSNGPFTVQFKDRTPFQGSTFQVPAFGSVCSGPLTPATKPKDMYKYDIVQNGKVVSDPQIIIRN